MKHTRSRLTRIRQNNIKQSLNIFYVVFSAITLIGVGYKYNQELVKDMPVQAKSEMVSPVPKTTPTPAPTPTPEPVVTINYMQPVAKDDVWSEKKHILAYLVEKFGDDAADAITMIRKCENSSFNPEAVNWNKNGTWDAGVMQINQIHGYSLEQMKDWKQNIDAGYKIYRAAGNTFYPWSCAGIIGQESYKDSL